MSNPIAADLRNWLSLHGYVKELPQEQEVALLRAIDDAIEEALNPVEKLRQIYFAIAAAAVGEYSVRVKRDAMIESRAADASASELLNEAVKMLANYSAYSEQERAEFYAKVNRVAQASEKPPHKYSQQDLAQFGESRVAHENKCGASVPPAYCEECGGYHPLRTAPDIITDEPIDFVQEAADRAAQEKK